MGKGGKKGGLLIPQRLFLKNAPKYHYSHYANFFNFLEEGQLVDFDLL